MKRLWVASNASSGSTSAEVVAELDKACARYDIVGRCEFPAECLPDAATLAAAGVDTLVILAGDGTINAATCKVDDWAGACLVLPGGTMNGLAKSLHGDAGWSEILDRAPSGRLVQLPVAACGEHRGMVGVILGPAASWFHAREAVREGAYAKLGRALLYAARKTFARTIRVVGDTRQHGRHRAVIVHPETDGLEIASISTSGWLAGARLGMDWLLGDWRKADDVTITHAPTVELVSSHQISALFDGEPTKLPSPVKVVHALTRLHFIATRPA